MKIYLAPMEGLADHFLRNIITNTGCYDLVFTEFVRVVNHLLPKTVFLKKAPELLNKGFTESNTPVRIQLLGNNPNALAENALRAIELGSHGVDLNFGCPSKTVNNSKGGAVLLTEPETLYRVVKAVREALPTRHVTSAKMRIGYEDHSLMLECAHAIAEGGANELTVHARTKAQGYKPPAHWGLVKEIKRSLPIPITINGEIWTPKDALNAIKDSECDHIMLGRGAITQPWLAKQIREHQGRATWPEALRLILEFWQLIATQMPPQYCAGRLKQWLKFLKEVYPEAEQLFHQIRPLSHMDEISVVLHSTTLTPDLN